MISFENLENGEILRNKYDSSELTVYVWRGEYYLASENSMWLTSEFDPDDWEKAE